MSSTVIKKIKTGYFRIPLKEVLVDAMHGNHTDFELITVTIELVNGSLGTGYTYTGGFGGRAIYDMIEYDLKPGLIGWDSVSVETLWEYMNRRVHYVARGGIASFAISAVDIALWDLRARNAGLPLYKLLGGSSADVKAYYGGIDLDFPLEKLLLNISGQLEKGHESVKIKLGKPRLEEDLERIKEVRKLVGPDRVFMVDANMSWTVQRTKKALPVLEEQNIYWLEEPIIPDDYPGLAEISRISSVPVAMGENYHTIYEHRFAIELSRVGFIQPDASNIGGITGWLKVANLAEAHNIKICTHGMQELHVSLLAAMPHSGYLEIHSFPIDEYTKRPVTVNSGIATAPDTVGSGVEFDEKLLAPHRIEL